MRIKVMSVTDMFIKIIECTEDSAVVGKYLLFPNSVRRDLIYYTSLSFGDTLYNKPLLKN